VGHSEGASGITSVIKTVLALEKREIPPNIFFDTPNPKIPFKEAQLQVPTEAMPWPKDRMERASVNCFGIGGANGHVVLDSRASFCKTNASPRNLKSLPDHSSRILFVSAKSTEALQQRIQDITRYVNEQPDLLTDIAYTLGARREHLSHRSFAVVSPNKPLDTSAFQIGQAKTTKVSFVFTGQGAQWAGMGKDLVEKFGCFREDIQMLNSALQELETPPTWSLLRKSSPIL
jgi:acyl transferase domain-containing protein